jgi:hypothetical protein
MVRGVSDGGLAAATLAAGETSKCAIRTLGGCVHPDDDGVHVDIPTVSFVSY